MGEKPTSSLTVLSFDGGTCQTLLCKSVLDWETGFDLLIKSIPSFSSLLWFCNCHKSSPLMNSFFFFATVKENTVLIIIMILQANWLSSHHLPDSHVLWWMSFNPLHAGFSFAYAQAFADEETEKVKQLAPNHQVNKGKASHLYLIWLQASALNQHGLPLCVNLFFFYWKKDSRMGSVRWSRFIGKYAC